MQASYAAREPRCYVKRIAANDVARKSKFIMLAGLRRRSPPGALRPVLCAVEDAHDFNGLIRDLIDGDVRQGWKRELPSSGHAAAGSANMGKVLQAGAAVIDGSGNPSGRFRVVGLYPFANALQILRGGQRPTDFHQGCRNR